MPPGIYSTVEMGFKIVIKTQFDSQVRINILTSPVGGKYDFIVDL